jgi:hypothetical protein
VVSDLRLFMKHKGSPRTSADFTYTSERQSIIAGCIQKSCPVLQKTDARFTITRNFPYWEKMTDEYLKTK